MTAGIAVWLAAGWIHAAPVRIELPPENPVLKPGAGSDLVRGQCLMCHSSEYFTTQPPLPRAYWKGAVEKMQGKYGAPIGAEQVEPLVDYLFRNYGAPEVPK